MAIFGVINGLSTYCNLHKTKNMVNIYLESKCDIPECNNEYSLVVNNQNYCLVHCPDKSFEMSFKRKCKYCDIEELSKFICKDCSKIRNKKEWMVVRHINRNIMTSFVYNSSKMLNECSRKRPDIFFELEKHCIIVEIDENQHKTYEDICECARINEIVNGIGGRSVIFIRFNPDKIKNNKKEIKIPLIYRLGILIEIIKDELSKDYDNFGVILLQLFYNDNYDSYQEVKVENITKLICV